MFWAWLDHLIFGNGYGLKSPFFDDRFYWLSGRLYTFFPGLGAQLQSFQWVHPKPGERRMLAGHEFRPFNSTRRLLRVRAYFNRPSMAGVEGLNFDNEINA